MALELICHLQHSYLILECLRWSPGYFRLFLQLLVNMLGRQQMVAQVPRFWRDLDQVPGSQLHPSPALPVAGISEEYQYKADLCSFLSPLPSLLSLLLSPLPFYSSPLPSLPFSFFLVLLLSSLSSFPSFSTHPASLFLLHPSLFFSLSSI